MNWKWPKGGFPGENPRFLVWAWAKETGKFREKGKFYLGQTKFEVPLGIQVEMCNRFVSLTDLTLPW